MLNYEKNNTYSFYTIDESYFIDSLEEDDKVYSHMNDQIIQSYCFSTGNTSLYRKVENNQLALLYDKISLNDTNSTAIYIYTPSMLYASKQKNGSFTDISSMDRKNFLFVANIFTPLSQVPGVKYINDILSIRYSAKHQNPVVSNSKLVDTKENRFFAKDFKETYMRYSMASNMIPAQCVLKNILKIVNQYIASRELDKNELLTNYINLQNFQEMCSGTSADISSFINEPSNIDLRSLCDSLRTKITNMDNLINMYLSDELEKDNKSL